MSDCSCFVGFIVNFVNPAAFKEFIMDQTVNPPAVRANFF